MQHKSNIQLIREMIEFKNKMFNSLNNFIDKYSIHDNIFQYYNENLCEVTSGYFEPIFESSNLKEIMDNYEMGMGIRIMEDKYQVGYIYKSITEGKNINKILEINHI